MVGPVFIFQWHPVILVLVVYLMYSASSRLKGEQPLGMGV